MICPKCEAEYVKGIEVCSDCGTKLIPKEEFEGNLLHPSDWITVYTTDEEYEAEMLKTNLESAGIETLIITQKDTSFPAVGDLAVIKVNVKKIDSDNAVMIIKDINSRKESDE